MPPLDEPAILESVARTSRLLVLQEASASSGVAGHVLALVARLGFEQLDAPPALVAAPDTPTPLSPALWPYTPLPVVVEVFTPVTPAPLGLALWPLTPVATVYLAQRRKQGKEHLERFRERRGTASAARPQGPLVWIHAASVGEATSVLGLIEHLLATRPSLEILITTGTVTSARLLETRLPPRALHQFVPADLPGWTARFLDYWQPDLGIWVILQGRDVSPS